MQFPLPSPNFRAADRLVSSPLVKIKEAAKLLAVSRTTVHNLIDTGDLKVVQLSPSRPRGKKFERLHLRITRSSLDAFVVKRSI